MRTILKWNDWKNNGSDHTMEIPRGRVLLVAEQTSGERNYLPTLWVEHEGLPEQVTALPYDHYVIMGTGDLITDEENNLIHVGSCSALNTTFIWHVYKVRNERDLVQALIS